MKRSSCMIIMAMLLLGCDASYEDQRAKLEKSVKSNRIGSSSDAWLIKLGTAGPERIALVFGFIDDLSFCREIADLYMKKYPTDAYRCELAN